MKALKKLLSFTLSMTLTVTSLLTPSLFTTAEETTAQSTSDSGTSMEGDPELVADSSIGGYISNVVGSGEGEQSGTLTDNKYSGNYGIENVEYDSETGTVILTTWAEDNCTAVVGFYTDDCKMMYTSVTADVLKDSETTAVTVDKSVLPEHFFVRVYLINDQLMPLCNSYAYNKMTAEMQEILAKTVNDFDADHVIQLDSTDETNNFYVLSDDTKLLDSTAETNKLESADFETGTYVFSNIDESMSSLAVGDVFSVTTDDTVIAAKVETISIDGTTATITGTADDEDVFRFIKIDTTKLDPSLFEGAKVDMSAADEGVTLSDKSFEETPVPELEEDVSTEEQNTVSASNRHLVGSAREPELTEKNVGEGNDYKFDFGGEAVFEIAKSEKKIGSDNANITMSLSFTVSILYKFEIEFYSIPTYASFSLKTGEGIKAKGSAKIEGELAIPLAVIDLPVCGVLHFQFLPKFVVRGSVEATVTVTRYWGGGFEWNTSTLKVNTLDGLKLELKRELKVDLKATLFIGLEFEFKGFIV